MDQHLKDFFSKHSDETPRGCFHQVIALHEAPDIDWHTISKKVPTLSKGWFELSRLPTKDRIEFTRDYWLTKLPYREGFSEFIVRFFDALDDIGIYVTQKKFDDPFEINLVYSLKGDSGFYRGGSPPLRKRFSTSKKPFPTSFYQQTIWLFFKFTMAFGRRLTVQGLRARRKCARSMNVFNRC